MSKKVTIDWDALDHIASFPPPPEFGPFVASVNLVDYVRHWDECGQPLDDDWKPDHQRVEDIAAAREGRKPRKVT